MIVKFKMSFFASVLKDLNDGIGNYFTMYLENMNSQYCKNRENSTIINFCTYISAPFLFKLEKMVTSAFEQTVWVS